nr:MAG TPA: hypothetical protein [Caudoviricetes sp.]
MILTQTCTKAILIIKKDLSGKLIVNDVYQHMK